MILDNIKTLLPSCLSVATLVLVATSATFLGVLQLVRRRRERTTLPPGPWSLPYIGSIPIFFTDPHKNLHRLKDKYGDIFTMYFGNQLFIVLASPGMVREAFVKNGDAISARPSTYYITKVKKGKGVAMTSGTVWKEQRRFALMVLCDFGMGRLSMEDKIKDAIHPFLEYLKAHASKEVDPAVEISTVVANVIGNIIFGQEYFDKDSADTKKFLNCIDENFRNKFKNVLEEDFPILRLLPGDVCGMKHTMQNVAFMEEYIKKSVTWHREHYVDGVVKDFIDAYLAKMKEEESSVGDENAGTFHESQLVGVIEDLFQAGVETTSCSLQWLFLYLATNPTVQKKIHQEIDTVFQRKEAPNLNKRSKCPYTEAVLMETQRCAGVAPLSLPHCVSHQVELAGFTLPPGAIVLANAWGIMHDERFWGDDVMEFSPERFLGDNGELMSKNEAYMPFSIGRRMCLGESLARMEMFLFTTTILQKFHISLPVESKHSLEGVYGLTMSTQPYKVIFEMREHS